MALHSGSTWKTTLLSTMASFLRRRRTFQGTRDQTRRVVWRQMWKVWRQRTLWDCGWRVCPLGCTTPLPATLCTLSLLVPVSFCFQKILYNASIAYFWLFFGWLKKKEYKFIYWLFHLCTLITHQSYVYVLLLHALLLCVYLSFCVHLTSIEWQVSNVTSQLFSLPGYEFYAIVNLSCSSTILSRPFINWKATSNRLFFLHENRAFPLQIHTRIRFHEQKQSASVGYILLLVVSASEWDSDGRGFQSRQGSVGHRVGHSSALRIGTALIYGPSGKAGFISTCLTITAGATFPRPDSC